MQTLLPDVEAAKLEAHLARLPGEYCQRFTSEQAASHLAMLCELSADAPCRVTVDRVSGAAGQETVQCTVVAFDHPFEFSLIAGTLAGWGLNIGEGDVYTLPRAQAPGRSAGRRRPTRRRSRVTRDPGVEPVIIDLIQGTRTSDGEPFEVWAKGLTQELEHTLALLDRGDEESITQAKRRVNERVTKCLRSMPRAPEPMLYPVELDVADVPDTGRIQLALTAQDTPAYLYALATALSLRGFEIDRIRIETNRDGSITDVIDLTPPATVGDRHRLVESARMSAVLTKQFTYHLGRAPDPFAALERFEKLTEDLLPQTDDADSAEWLKLLSDPRSMRGLAKLLGTSAFLWEDFIRGQYETLAPILAEAAGSQRFAPHPETLPRRLEQALDGAIGLAEQQDRLNAFKDREIFLLDLDHILNPSFDFRAFSARLTFLAENLVAQATWLVYLDLVRSYGTPPAGVGADGRRRLPYAVFGLGKLGGVALGYASDIELLFVYEGDPTEQTSGAKREPISVGEFFETLAREASQFIHSKRDGIFDVDLRLRPYGKEGPLASSVEKFEGYYGKGGPAHAFEKLALVRMRWIAGSPELGYKVEQLRDEFVYEQSEAVLDLDGLWEIWSQMKQQKLSGDSRLNAKYSPGTLVDLEGTVQLLQVKHATQAPQLRVPRLSQAMESLHRAGVLSASEFALLRGAYDFYRQLINALRVLRGNARDLFLPPAESMEIAHLARRMEYVDDPATAADEGAESLLADFDRHRQAVQAFISDHFGRPCPGMSHT